MGPPVEAELGAGCDVANIRQPENTLPVNLPPSPSIDKDALPTRRRRRRTSPHDQAVLELEYRKCTKPDKTRRREICKLVQMEEKEVQIWFCNKRQAQRRRSTPLRPHEMVPKSTRSISRVASFSSLISSSPVLAHRVGGGGVGQNPASDDSFSSGFPSSPSSSSHHHPNNNLQHPPRYEEFDHENYIHQEGSKDKLKEIGTKSRNLQLQLTSLASDNNVTGSHATASSSATSTSKSISQEKKMTTSAHNRLQDVLNNSPTREILTAESSLPSTLPFSNSTRQTNPTTPGPSRQPPLLRRTPSSVRLTTSLEGKATVVLDTDISSSPPDVPTTTQGGSKSTPARSIQKHPINIPVDSKLWEFCCDNQSAIRSPAQTPPQPSEATQALRLLRTRRRTATNAKGNVPSLLRSLSQSKPCPDTQPLPLPISPSKQPTNNAHLQLPPPVLPPPLPPPPSSSARKIPTKKKDRKVITSNKKASRPKPLSAASSYKSAQKKSSKAANFAEPSLDSDKENQAPGAPVSPPPELKRRGLGVSGRGTVVPTPSSSRKGGKKRLAKSQPLHDKIEGHFESREEINDNGEEPNGDQDGRYALVGQDAVLSTATHRGLRDNALSITAMKTMVGINMEEEQENDNSQGSGIMIREDLLRARDEIECIENLLGLREGTWG